MDALTERVYMAKAANAELERLVEDYMPFIRRTAGDAVIPDMEYDDKMSLAMLTFVNCVKQYDKHKGNFTGFAAVCIRNRLIDEGRRQMRHAGRIIPLFGDEDDSAAETPEDKAAVAAYNQERERERLLEEIEAVAGQLSVFGISFGELPKICPKQERARKQCVNIGRCVATNNIMREALFKHRRLMQSSLASQFGISEKTVEKHRKYIIAVAVIYTGDYPCIRAFLPRL